jgi:hypothetical protein
LGKYLNDIKKHLKYIKPAEFEYDIHVSLKYRYVYVETPKAGCSTIKDTLQRIELDYPDLVREDLDDIHKRALSPLIKPAQTCNFDRILNNPDYFVFCFVRDPYTRLLSAYLDKIVRGFPQKVGILAAMGEDPGQLSKEITFDEFVDVVCKQDISEMDPHWRIQYYQTFQDTIKYDFIGKLENFVNDSAVVFSKITKEYEKYFRVEQRHATSSNDLMRDYYNEKIINKVNAKYKIDFENFGYEEKY